MVSAVVRPLRKSLTASISESTFMSTKLSSTKAMASPDAAIRTSGCAYCSERSPFRARPPFSQRSSPLRPGLRPRSHMAISQVPGFEEEHLVVRTTSSTRLVRDHLGSHRWAHHRHPHHRRQRSSDEPVAVVTATATVGLVEPAAYLRRKYISTSPQNLEARCGEPGSRR